MDVVVLFAVVLGRTAEFPKIHRSDTVFWLDEECVCQRRIRLI